MEAQFDPEIASRVRDIVTRMALDKLEEGVEINDATPLFYDDDQPTAIFDSFDAVMIFIELENEFGFQIADEDMMIENFNTVNHMTSYIQEHQQLA